MSALDTDLLLAGGGLASQRCCETLRRLGYDGRITLLCAEARAPYNRPPLSKAVLSNAGAPPPLELRPPRWHAEHEIELLLGCEAVGIDLGARAVTVRGARTNGAVRRVRYRKLVIATGSRPRRLPMLPLGGAVHELRSERDALALRGLLHSRQGRLAVLGAGLVGMEVAASAQALGWQVSMIEAAAAPLARALPARLGGWLAGLHRAHGIDVRLGTTVERASLGARRARLALSDGSTLPAEAVLVAAGTVPATDWLAASGLSGGALRTDSCGRTRLPCVYAAGDVACFPDPYLGAHAPTQHWEAAARQGIAVAHALVGVEPPRALPPMFWSDQYGRRIQLVGHAPAGCEVELAGDTAGGAFTAWLTCGARPMGALLVDRPHELPRVRRWIDAAHATEEEDRDPQAALAGPNLWR